VVYFIHSRFSQDTAIFMRVASWKTDLVTINSRGSLNLGNRSVTIDQAESSISSFPKGGAQNPFDIYRRA